MNKLPIRDDLIRQVLGGKLAPHEAEEEADRLGLTPLRHIPYPHEFNPVDEPYWSLPTTLAWVINRDIDSVRAQWDKYRAACTHWEELWGGFRLVAGAKANLVSLWAEARSELSVMDAFSELSRGALDDKPVLIGFTKGEPIPPPRWHNAVLQEVSGKLVVHLESGANLVGVFFKNEEVRAVWPDAGSEEQPSEPPKENKGAGKWAQAHAHRFMNETYPEGLPAGMQKTRVYRQYKGWSADHTPPETPSSKRSFDRALGNK